MLCSRYLLFSLQLAKTTPRHGGNKPHDNTGGAPTRRSKIPAASQPRHARHIPNAVLGKNHNSVLGRIHYTVLGINHNTVSGKNRKIVLGKTPKPISRFQARNVIRQ